MKTFRISGNFKMGSQMQKFCKDIEAETPEEAHEKLLCIMGSKHKVARRFINVFEIIEAGTTDKSVVLE